MIYEDIAGKEYALRRNVTGENGWLSNHSIRGVDMKSTV